MHGMMKNDTDSKKIYLDLLVLDLMGQNREH